MAKTASAPRYRAATAMTDRRCIVSEPVPADVLLAKGRFIGAPCQLEVETANGRELWRRLDWPPPQLLGTKIRGPRAGWPPGLRSRVRLIAQMAPSPSLGPPLLSESWSPPLFCGMPLLDGGAGFGAGFAGAGFGAVGAGAGFGAAGCDAEPPDFLAETCLPAGEIANQRPPKAFSPSPFVSPAFLSITKP